MPGFGNDFESEAIKGAEGSVRVFSVLMLSLICAPAAAQDYRGRL
jgi:hypothetical protein